MKTSMRLLLALAAVIFFALPAYCLPAVQSVTIDLTGATLQGGKNLELSSTVPIETAPIYYYAISGTVTGAGKLQYIFPSGSLAELFTTVDPGLVPYLSGTLPNVSDKLPFIVVNALKSGHVTVTNKADPILDATYYGSARIKIGISKTGLPYIDLTNVSFGVKSHIPGVGSFTDRTDAFTFTGGQVVVQTNPIVAGYQPDLSFYLKGQLYGVGITSTNGTDESVATVLGIGHSIKLPVFLQNIGDSPDTYTLTATQFQAGWAQAFYYKGKNITAAVLGSGFTIPPDDRTIPEPLPSGAITGLTWVIANKDAVSFFSSAQLTATSNGDPTKQDSIDATVIVPVTPR